MINWILKQFYKIAFAVDFFLNNVEYWFNDIWKYRVSRWLLATKPFYKDKVLIFLILLDIIVCYNHVYHWFFSLFLLNFMVINIIPGYWPMEGQEPRVDYSTNFLEHGYKRLFTNPEILFFKLDWLKKSRYKRWSYRKKI